MPTRSRGLGRRLPPGAQHPHVVRIAPVHDVGHHHVPKTHAEIFTLWAKVHSHACRGASRRSLPPDQSQRTRDAYTVCSGLSSLRFVLRFAGAAASLPPATFGSTTLRANGADGRARGWIAAPLTRLAMTPPVMLRSAVRWEQRSQLRARRAPGWRCGRFRRRRWQGRRRR